MILFKHLKAALSQMPHQQLNLQGGTPNNSHIITCKHPKFNTTLYVSEVHKKYIKYTGNIRNALRMTSGTAKNVRDDVLESKRNVNLLRIY